MTSALDARPKLRDDVKIVQRESRGKVHYVVKVPSEQKYFQFGRTEVALMRLMDGRRTPSEIAQAADKALGVLPPAGQIADFAHKLKRMGIVERTPAEQRMILVEHLRSDRKARSRGRTRGSILRLRFSLGDPDAQFGWIVSRMRWAWTPGFVWVSVGFFVAYGLIIAGRWDEFWGGTVGMYTLSGFGLWDWVLLYGLFFGIGAVHELGHGLTTKALGGEVREWGGMMLYFNPALYCNTNDAWTFEKRAHRLWVNFAGPWIELLLAAIAAIVWVTTEPDTFLYRLAFLTILSGGIVAVLGNLNPLLPLDGYYALSDWLEVPNLRRRSFEYWSWVIKRFALGMQVAEPRTTPRERRIFLIYGASAMAYSVLVAIVSLLWLILVLGRFLGPWVWAVLALAAFSLFSKLAGRWSAVGQAASTTWRASFNRGGRRTALLAAVILVIGLPFIIPWTFRAQGDFIVEATPRAHLRAAVGGILDEWHVNENDVVQPGDPIATLWNPELESSLFELRAHAERLMIERASAEAGGDRAAAAAAASALKEVQLELSTLQARRDRMVVKSPIAGIVLGNRLHQRLGSLVDEGDLLVQIAADSGRLARVRIPLKKAGEVAVGQPVALKLSADPSVKFRAAVTGVAPAAENGWLQAEVRLPAGRWQPAPGMLGIAKIETRKANIAQAIARAVRQTVRIDLWL